MSNNLPTLFILSAPAGCGKTTLVKMLTDENPEIIQSISYTTRPKRAVEVDGRDYRFTTLHHFLDMQQRGEFLEYAQVFGHYYGTSKSFVESKLKTGKHVILVIDVQGARQVMEKKLAYPVKSIFILPPSIDELKRRMIHRGTESVEVIERRLNEANKEILEGSNYDYQIVNDDLQKAYQELKNIIEGKPHV